MSQAQIDALRADVTAIKDGIGKAATNIQSLMSQIAGLQAPGDDPQLADLHAQMQAEVTALQALAAPVAPVAPAAPATPDPGSTPPSAPPTT